MSDVKIILTTFAVAILWGTLIFISGRFIRDCPPTWHEVWKAITRKRFWTPEYLDPRYKAGWCDKCIVGTLMPKSPGIWECNTCHARLLDSRGIANLSKASKQ